MNLRLMISSFPCSFLIFFLSLILMRGVSGATFTFANRCDYTVWPGILSSAGSPPLETTGFELPKATSRSFQVPPAWSGRFWARTLCNFDEGSGQGTCATGDCGSGQVECNGAGASPPATLAEFTLGSDSTSSTQDFYDVSLVDGYNLPLVVEATGGSGGCLSTGCVTDLNRQCPAELSVGNGAACKSACEAFGTPEYCCSGDYGSPTTCKPSVYSEMFKSACPRSYSYAYDDATSTFTCTGADYTITFCYSSSSNSPNNQKRDSTTRGGAEAAAAAAGEGGSSSSSEGAMLADGSWLEGLAAGGSASSRNSNSALLMQSTILFIGGIITIIFPLRW